jgi:nucleoside-diphosphate-sugar epimerase
LNELFILIPLVLVASLLSVAVDWRLSLAALWSVHLLVALWLALVATPEVALAKAITGTTVCVLLWPSLRALYGGEQRLTRHMLDLAGAGRRTPMVFHVSTAFVAGARRAGVVYEDELTDAYGFEGTYERSKYEAEQLVHTWARATGRPVVIFRPSVLTTDLPPHPDLPEHPLLNIERTLSGIARTQLGPGRTPDVLFPDNSRFRILGRPDGQLNLMPVESAAAVMARLADLPPADGVETYHVVHGRETPVDVFRRLVERLSGVRIAVVPELPDPSPHESVLALVRGVFCYLRQHRWYDDSRVRARLGPAGVPEQLSLEYLLSGLPPRTEAAPVDLAPHH